MRYYYDKNIIQKTGGKRYVYRYVQVQACVQVNRCVYRFVCDMQSILGQTPLQFFQRIGITPQGITDDD